MTQLVALVAMIVITILGNTGEVWEAWDMQQLAPDHHYHDENILFEDSSFIITILGESYSGCVPDRLCSDN